MEPGDLVHGRSRWPLQGALKTIAETLHACRLDRMEFFMKEVLTMNVRDLIPWSRGEREVSRGFRPEPMSPVVSLHREMNRLFDDMFRGVEGPRLWGERREWPIIEVEETDKDYRVTAELPGMEGRDVEVLLQDGVLILRGERKLASESRDRTFSERFYGHFERQLSFDRAVDDAGVTAAFRNGVLTVTVPKAAQAMERVRRIPVNEAGKAH